MSKQLLADYVEAWNTHNIDKIMSFMTDDCVFETGGGTERWGTRYQGSEQVRQRFIEVWTDLPDVHFVNGHHFADGDSGCSEWTFTATRADGQLVEMNGCDLFTFRDRKILEKRSYIKNRK
ncbi:MAG: ketosteroid isomerase-like protein [Gammaproteobacteria bacterium]|jgi:ketosteroid isomerase-like protein